jgi:hypothetical protein
MTRLRTRHTKLTLATRRQSDLGRSPRNRYEFGLASAKLLPTTSLCLRRLMRALRGGNRSRREERVPWRLRMLTLEIAINVARRRGALPLRR